MRILAALIALVLVAVPFAACGGGGGGCTGVCGPCTFSTECCGSELCTNQTTSGFRQCENFDFQCKVGS